MSCDTLRTIKLGGVLGKKFGRVHKLAVATPAEAIRALCVLHQGFREFLERSHKNNVGYKFIVGNEVLSPDTVKDEAHLARGEDAEFILSPVMVGAKSAWGQILMGAVLIAASFFVPVVGSFLLKAGIGLALGGVSQLLSPAPKASEPKERDANKPSYIFNGAVNTTAQGQPVPILYGRMIIGSAVVSAGITSKDIPL